MASPFLQKNSRLSCGIHERLLHTPLPKADIWIQAASAGEAYLAKEMLYTLRPFTTTRILLTSGTSQGYDILKDCISDKILEKRKINAFCAYFPFDHPKIMDAAVKQVNPVLGIAVETEIWPGFFKSLRKNGSTIFIVNGRLRKSNLQKYGFLPGIWKEIQPDIAAAVSAEDGKHFERLFGMQPSRVIILPNMKFDRLDHRKQGKGEFPDFALPAGRTFVILASVRKEEAGHMKVIIPALVNRYPDILIGLFPRDMHRIPFWENFLKGLGIRYQMRSGNTPADPLTRVILWDRFGELQKAYAAGDAVFVGGSLCGRGGQNFLEALGFGIVPVIGPSWENFFWVGKEITDKGLLKVGKTSEEVLCLMQNQVEEPRDREAVKQQFSSYIEHRKGGVQKTCALIEESLFLDQAIDK